MKNDYDYQPAVTPSFYAHRTVIVHSSHNFTVYLFIYETSTFYVSFSLR